MWSNNPTLTSLGLLYVLNPVKWKMAEDPHRLMSWKTWPSAGDAVFIVVVLLIFEAFLEEVSHEVQVLNAMPSFVYGWFSAPG